MLKKFLWIAAFVVIVGLLVFGAVNRTLAKNGSEAGNGSGLAQSVNHQENLTVEAYRRNGNGQNGEQVYLPPASTTELSADETAALLFMREEEKLAHDVYSTLYAAWGLPVFQNISQSEDTHTEAVKTLLDRYQLNDPAVSEIGVFTNQDLQALYNQLIARGSQSLSEALKVGTAIEEIDILDLQMRLAQTDHVDIQQVFDNLMKGSYNHLQAFVSTLNTQTGEVYAPQYLSAQDYQTIIGASTAAGNGSRGGGQGGGGQTVSGQGGGFHGGRP
jgi:hypothetical protein